MKQTQKYVSFIYWQWLHLTVLPPSSVPTSILRVPSSNQVICFFSPLNSDSIIKISENTSGLKWSQVKKKKKKNPLYPNQPSNLYWFCIMQHFQSSAACVFLWRSVAASKFALQLVYLHASPKALPLRPSSTLFRFLFHLWTSLPSPNILYARNTFISSAQKWKFLEVHFAIKVPEASPWIPIAALWCLLLDANSFLPSLLLQLI